MILGTKDVLDLEDSPIELFDSPESASNGAGVFELPSDGLVFEELERSLVEQALKRARGNQTRAGKLLGMNRDQIRYRIEKFGIRIPTPDNP